MARYWAVVRRGFQTVRFTHEQVRYEPDYVRDTLRRLLLAKTSGVQPFLE